MKSLLLAATAVAGVTLATTPASATLQIAADINGVNFFCADQNAVCDTNPLLGQLTIANQTIGGVNITGSSQTQVIGATNSLNTSSLQIQNNNAVGVNIQVAVGGIDFVGPTAAFIASGSGTFQSAIGSTISMGFYGDNTNTQGADSPGDLPGVQLAVLNKNALLATDAFAQNDTGAFVTGGLFGMSLGTTAFLTAGGSLVSRGQAILADQVEVPEPGSLGLLGLGLMGLGMVYSRRKQS
jgi:hypothetical protein